MELKFLKVFFIVDKFLIVQVDEFVNKIEDVVIVNGVYEKFCCLVINE